MSSSSKNDIYVLCLAAHLGHTKWRLLMMDNVRVPQYSKPVEVARAFHLRVQSTRKLPYFRHDHRRLMRNGARRLFVSLDTVPKYTTTMAYRDPERVFSSCKLPPYCDIIIHVVPLCEPPGVCVVEYSDNSQPE